MQITFLCCLSFYYYLGNTLTKDWRRVFASFFTTLSQMYPEFALYLFALISNITQTTLQCITVHADENQDRLNLEWIKKKHVIVCEMIDSINATFGPFLLFRIASTFLNLTSSSFYIFGLQGALLVTAVDVVFVIVDLMHLAIPCLSANGIHNEA